MATITPSIALSTFWEAHIAPPITALCTGTYPLPEVQKRFLENRDQIYERYSINKLTLVATTVHGKNITPLGCVVRDGVPEIGFHVYSLMNLLDRLQISHHITYREIFEAMLVAGLLHETDHFALGRVGGDVSNKLKNEQYTWAVTCEYTLRPMIEIHQKSFLPGIIETYNAWVACSRDVESKHWRRYIQALYS